MARVPFGQQLQLGVAHLVGKQRPASVFFFFFLEGMRNTLPSKNSGGTDREVCDLRLATLTQSRYRHIFFT
tara:strand:- start:414 stop:626 length:213 start_codon:yes stop_codon:yes gene_type:complete